MLESVHVLVHHNDVILQSKCHNVPITSKLSVIGREIRRSFPRAGVSPHKSGALPNASNKIGKSMAQANLPANTHFRVQATKHGGPVDDFEHEWDEWIPMLPQLEELPWSLQDISKVLRLGRTRDHFRIVSPQAVERVSFLLQRPLLRILREAKRLSVRYSRCSKQEIQTSIRLVFSVSMARTCLALASKALSLYIMSVDRFRRSKRIRSGLILPVGKIFRWLVEIKVAPRIYDAAAIYLTATLEYIAEELVFRAVNNIEPGLDQVTPEVLERWISLDADLWGMFEPYYHLLSGRTAFGVTDSIEIYGAATRSANLTSSRRQPLEKCFTTTCVTSVAELKELVSQIQKQFAEVYQSKENKFLSQLAWSPTSLPTLFYFMKCSHQIDEDISDILAASRRAHSHLPPLIEWLRVVCIHAEHRKSSVVDDDDVRQAAWLLMPFNDCEPRPLCFGDSLCSSRTLSASAATVSFQQDLGLRMLCCGRTDILQQALAMLGPEKANTVNTQGMTPLMYACANGNEALVQTLLENHAWLDAQVPNNQQIYPLMNLELKAWTALSFAAMGGHVNACQKLLSAGANPNGTAAYGRDGQVETPLYLAAAAGNYELVSLLVRSGADPFISITASGFGRQGVQPAGFGNAFAAAAAHGRKNILRKLLSEPAAQRDNEMMSLAEILSEGSLTDSEGERRLTKRRSKALEEAMYHSCEHGFLDITMELRSLGVPWNIRCWSQSLGIAYETGHKSFLRCLLRDFQSMPDDEYTAEFCEDGLIILFNIFQECEDHAVSKDLASVLSRCFGQGPPNEISALPPTIASIRIGPDYINSPEMSDITFLVEGRPVYAHKIILATASKRFKAMLAYKSIDDSEGKIPYIEISDIKYETFMFVIQFLYSGDMDEPSDQNKVLELLQATQFFMLDTLKRRCERLAAEKLSCDNAVETYQHAKLCAAKELLSYCEEFILRNLPAMMDIRSFRDALLNHDSNDLLHALQSSLVQRIKSRTPSQVTGRASFNPLRPNSDLSQTSHCNMKGV